MLELATVKLVSGIAEGTVRGSYGDLERLLRLEGFLKGTDQSIPREEVARLFDLFLLAIEREIDDPEQRQPGQPAPRHRYPGRHCKIGKKCLRLRPEANRRLSVSLREFKAA